MMDGDKTEELALYMLFRLPAELNAQENGAFHYIFRSVAAGIEYALQKDEKNLADKVSRSLMQKALKDSCKL